MLLGEHSLLRDGFTDKEYQCHTSKQVTCAVCRQHRSWGWSNPRQHGGDLHNTGRCCSRTWAVCGWGRRVPEQPAASSGFCAELPPCSQAQGSTSAPLPRHICWDFLRFGLKTKSCPTDVSACPLPATAPRWASGPLSKWLGTQQNKRPLAAPARWALTGVPKIYSSFVVKGF